MKAPDGSKNKKNNNFKYSGTNLSDETSLSRSTRDLIGLSWINPKTLISFSRQVYFVFAYCFLLIVVLGLTEAPTYFLIIGLLLCLFYTIWSEIRNLKYRNLEKYDTELTNTLFVEVEMRYVRDISAALKRQLDGLIDKDIEWLVSVGKEKKLTSDQVIIHEDQSPEALYLILEGKFEISTNSRKLFSESIPISTVDSGILGEMSLVPRRNQYRPSATVKARENALVWSIPKQQIENKIKLDLGFGSRFNGAIAGTIADRLEAANEFRASTQKRRLVANRRRRRLASYSTPDSLKTLGSLLYTIDNPPR